MQFAERKTGGAGEGALIQLSHGTIENRSICISGCIIIIPANSSQTPADIMFLFSEEQDNTKDNTRDEHGGELELGLADLSP